MELYTPVIALVILAAGFAIFSLVASVLTGPSATTGPSSTPTSAASSRPRSPSAAVASR